MYPNRETIDIAVLIEEDAIAIMRVLCLANRQALSTAATEVHYVRTFAERVENAWGSTVWGSGTRRLQVRTRVKSIHGRAIVEIIAGGSRCELGDLLLVVKYAKGATVLGQKVVVFQAKLDRSGWDINPIQHRLLSEWPPFRFGNAQRHAGPHQFDLRPREREFGSYLLARRDGLPQGYPGCYDFCPLPLLTDWRILVAATSSTLMPGTPVVFHAHYPYPWVLVAIACDAPAVPQRKRLHPHHLRYGRCLVFELFDLLTWRRGEWVEPGSTMHEFVSALYRLVGLQEDPPGEFEGYHQEDGGFTILEITVASPE
ncbi:MAG: hypothetical protein ACOY3F_02840 [Bacillota bacterium]